jgi:hypothetical protein
LLVVCGVLLLVAALQLPGCSTTGEDTTADEDEFIGRPPTPEEDPFSVRGNVRGEAVEATPQGQISEDDFEEPTPRDDLDANPDEWDEALGSTQPEEQSKPDEDATLEVVDGTVRCFSCVKICPVEGGCDEAKRDVICGWGAHSTREQASKMARGECNATLDMARQMPVWSRIDGECPAATCRRP